MKLTSLSQIGPPACRLRRQFLRTLCTESDRRWWTSLLWHQWLKLLLLLRHWRHRRRLLLTIRRVTELGCRHTCSLWHECRRQESIDTGCLWLHWRETLLHARRLRLERWPDWICKRAVKGLTVGKGLLIPSGLGLLEGCCAVLLWILLELATVTGCLGHHHAILLELIVVHSGWAHALLEPGLLRLHETSLLLLQSLLLKLL